MAKARSEAKRDAILQAAVHEIAEVGLAAATAKIALRAGVATGSFFTYFPTKQDLLNELYLELKLEVFDQLNATFPTDAALKDRVRHIWEVYLDWSFRNSEKRKVSALLHVSDIAEEFIRQETQEARQKVDRTLEELTQVGHMDALPKGYAAACMSAMQAATMEFLVQNPKDRDAIATQAFEVFWRLFE